MISLLKPIVVVVPVAFAVNDLRGGLEWVVLVVAAAAAVGVLWRGARKALHYLEEIADGSREMLTLVKGDKDQPGLSVRLEGLEREVTHFRRVTEGLTDLARDEHVKDVRDLLRRGQVPHPLLDEDERAKSEGD